MIRSMILGLSGKKQSGKDSICSFLIRNCRELFGHDLAVRVGLADSVKEILAQYFDVEPRLLHGTGEDKNELIPGGRMTARRAMQHVGTELAKVNPMVWVDHMVKKAKFYASHGYVVVIPDVRFPKEVMAINALCGRTIRLTRGIGDDPHVSETSLDSFSGFDHVLDNRNLTIAEQNCHVASILCNWNWMEADRPEKTPGASAPLSLTQAKEEACQ